MKTKLAEWQVLFSRQGRDLSSLLLHLHVNLINGLRFEGTSLAEPSGLETNLIHGNPGRDEDCAIAGLDRDAILITYTHRETQRTGIALTQANLFSEREEEVIDLLEQGKSNKQIALALAIAESTVESHLTKIYAKLGVGSRVEAILRLRERGKTLEPAEEDETGESIIEIQDPRVYSPDEPVVLNRESQAVAKKISLEEIIRFLVTYKIPIFIWVLLILVIVLAVLSSKKTAWTYEREGEYPDEFTVGLVLQRSSASKEMVHAQFGTVPAWPAQPGYVKYNNISIPRADHLFLKLRYSKYSSSSVRILVYLDEELSPRAAILPIDQGSWDKFVWTDAIDLGSVKRGVHSIKFYTDGQVFGVADLDKFTLTTEPP